MGNFMDSVELIMTPELRLTHVDHSLAEAAKRMKAADVGALFVVDGDELVGVVTDRDLVVRGLAPPEAGRPETVGNVLTRHVAYCRTGTPITAAAALMAQQRIRRLAVVDEACQLVGVVSLADLARREAGARPAAVAILRSISVPTERAKTAAPEDPTGGRARGSPPGTLHVYAERPRLRRRDPTLPRR